MQDNLAKPFRYLARNLQGANRPPPVVEKVAPCTVVAFPVERAAAVMVRAAFDAAILEYGPSSVFDLYSDGLEMCDSCSSLVADLLKGCAAAEASATHILQTSVAQETSAAVPAPPINTGGTSNHTPPK